MSSIARDSSRVPPVWERLPQIFGYPFKPACLTTLGLAALLYAIGMLVPLLGLILVIVAWVVLYKFAYDVLEATARGWMTPPEIQRKSNSWVLVKTFGLFVLLGIAVTGIAIATGSMVLVATTSLFIVAALPAAIITLAMSNSLMAALNPGTWVSIMRSVGLPYFIASLLLLMLSISQGMAESMVAGVFGPNLLGQVGVFLIGGYFLVASFHLMGYLVYQHHHSLGVEQEVSAADRARAANPDLTPLLQEVEGLVADGNVGDAIDRLQREFRQSGLQPQEHERYRKLLHLQGRTEDLLAHSRAYISTLLYGLEQPKKAMSIAEEALRLDTSFQPEDPRQVRDLARLADQYEHHDLVIRLTSPFGKENPKHPHLPENYYLGAKALFEGRGDEQKALKILRQLQKHFPDHELRDRVDELAERAERIAAS
ncbi:DUF4013 domain-containing protein [Salicola sp. Rm-C-2C1-2]|uniref:DUF4013 domain-containing protein n=1 Tax=Salicola sp. Rm-C-2C1-2 TaxID=3141321 RepID=UPI0032E3DAEB